MAEISPEALKLFRFWGTILALKVLAMLPLTAQQRFGKKIYMNEEDVTFLGKGKVVLNDPDVERVRKAHRNDLENILPWFMITYLWLSTGPSLWLANALMRTFVIARIIYTISYLVIKKQPIRFLVFFVGYGITLYQAFSTLLYYS
ncbi:microsomal glutathione S-transferase 1-like [Nylanderia fulva]|uniref:microsomal glutathione S-transferase 1-like n=1 Tax=Nylanderia fulva TaxID=613905 RepID=UPI0010FAE63C|nr:microsomal glutathione S-transferase 1-like [Nylanderia fulva]